MHFVYYDSNSLAEHQYLPGIENFLEFFTVYGPCIAPVDRTGALKFPVRMKSLFPLPEMRATKHCYEELCNERAKELLARAEKLDTSLYAFWSGGIDSTCLLISLLKCANSAQRERIVVLMSEQSIAEYPLFYRKYIRGWLRRESATMFPYFLGTKNILVTGECNDQLFGSDITPQMGNRFGHDVVQQPYDPDLFVSFFADKTKSYDIAELYVQLFEQLKAKAPVELKTNFDMFWWINFALKWQTVYMRVLSWTAERNLNLLSLKYLQSYYAPFYNTDGFQLWSMNNPDKRMRNGWRSYKWPAKEVIYDFTKDADYRDNKLKRGSLFHLIGCHVPPNFIDDKIVFYKNKELASEHFYEPNNDLV